jgi:hypothetical protein
MLKQVKKYFSLVAFIVFLFPLVAGNIHNIQHADDSHCRHAKHHLHQPEHHCLLCDYSISSTNGVSPELFSINIFYTFSKIISFNTITGYLKPALTFNLRGPPCR